MKPYKVYVLRYARRDAHSSEIVIGDYHRAPLDMAYYMWIVTNGEHTAVVDMGFTAEMCKRRGRQWLAEPEALMDSVGVNPKKVEHVVISHLHWDHVGNYELFPRAKYYLQEDEMAFWTGKYVKYPVFNQAIEVEDICAMVRYNYDGRILFTNGTQEILPGVKVHRVGGHTKGIQIVEAALASGPAVVASDATHTYRNINEMKPFLILHDVPGYLDGFETIKRLAKDEQHIFPGHDAEVMKRHLHVSENVCVLE